MKTLKDALRSSEFTVTAELALSPKDRVQDIISQSNVLATSVDAIQIPDHRNAQPHITPVAVAAHMMPEGIDPIVRLNCRDRNRIAIQSELLTARYLGISNLLLARGSDLPEDHRPKATGVYDLSAIDLVRTAAAIRDGVAMAEGRLEDAPDFHIGTVATAFRPKDDWTPEKLLAKADAGAEFIQLQLCMDTDALGSYMAHLVKAKLTWRFQVLANIAVLPSVEKAREMRRTNPGAMIPSALITRLELAKDPEAEGVAIAAEALRVLRDTPGIAGANIHTMGDANLIVAAVEQSGVRRNDRT